MTDAAPILEAEKLGYPISCDKDGNHWYFKQGIKVGPFKTLEDAAYEALADHEMVESYKFWKGKE